mmetsp:Transcript_38850/g.82640  ORF Transcript_38850/g.82640 Transcript_38850/m.82640 type:complete len:204 (-) Transcript_38850:35-646(-)
MGGSLGTDSGAIENLPGQSSRVPAALQTLYSTAVNVDLAATPLTPAVPGLQAFHTSILLNGAEYYFDKKGIVCGGDMRSHRMFTKIHGKTLVKTMGLTTLTSEDMCAALRPYFESGTYDMLRKNCNSFSDCALFYLLDMRLDAQHRGLEQLGATVDMHASVVQMLTEGKYHPNPKAAEFDIEQVIKRIDWQKGFMDPALFSNR